jgi:hypothetical protein
MKATFLMLVVAGCSEPTYKPLLSPPSGSPVTCTPPSAELRHITVDDLLDNSASCRNTLEDYRPLYVACGDWEIVVPDPGTMIARVYYFNHGIFVALVTYVYQRVLCDGVEDFASAVPSCPEETPVHQCGRPKVFVK